MTELTQAEWCFTFDGTEHCCLHKGHPGPHMGRWYTMSPTAIAIAEAKYREERDALGESELTSSTFSLPSISKSAAV